MRRRTFILARAFAVQGALAAVTLTGCAALHPMSKSTAARGHAVAVRECSACHAVEPRGVSPRAEAPAFDGPRIRHTAGLDGRVADLTRLGHYDMPPSKLSPDEVREVTAYIESLGPP